MIMLKLLRILVNKRYVKDNSDYVAGDNELLRKLLIAEEKTNDK